MDQRDLEKLRAGDSGTLANCVAVVRQWARTHGLRPDDAEDLAAAVVTAAWKESSSFRAESSLETWLIGIAGRMRVQQYRAARIHAPEARPLPDEEELPSEQEMEEATLRRMVAEEFLESLTPDEREVLQLRFGEGLSSEEAARKMGKPSANSVRCLQMRALKRAAACRRRWDDHSGQGGREA